MKRCILLLGIILTATSFFSQTIVATSEYKEYNVRPKGAIKGPNIQIDTPENYAKTTADEITLSGRVTDPDGIFQLTVDMTIIDIDKSGRFKATVQLTDGLNKLKIKALDKKYQANEIDWVLIKNVSGLRKGKDYAIIFATDQYDDKANWKPLSNAVIGGREVAAILAKEYSFLPIRYENYTRREMEAEIRNLYRKLGSEDQVFIYISSHGEQDPLTKEGYLACKDSKGNDWSTYMHHASLSSLLNNLPAKQVFVCIDACYSSTFDSKLMAAIDRGRGDRLVEGMSLKQFVDSKLKLKSRLYLTSGLTKTSAGKPGELSPFTKQLINCFRSTSDSDGVLTFNEIRALFDQKKLKPEPKAGEFGTRHQPGGNFLFIRKNK